MSLDQNSVSAFSDELTKIGVAKTVGKWIRTGWDDIGSLAGTAKAPKKRLGGLLPAKPVRGNGWLGAQDTWRRNLPVGGKSMFVGLTGGLAVPQALKKQDPLGQERSRTERSVDLGADVVGGLAGAGALLASGSPKWRLTKSLVGGIGGGLLASRIATTPWRRAREQAAKPVLTGQERQQLLQQYAR